MTTIYGISNCDTIKKTLRWFNQHELPYEFHDYRKQGITQALVKTFAQQIDLDVLINRRGTTWRKLPQSTKDKLNPKSAIELMCNNPALIKRPIISSGERWIVGYDLDSLNSLL